MLELVAALIKAVAYAASLTASGTVLARATLLHRHPTPGTAPMWVPRLAGVTLALAVAGTALLFWLRLGGEEDAAMLHAVFISPLGASLALQLAGALWIAVLVRRPMAVVGALLIVLSFGVSGHAATQGIVTSVTVVLHVGAVAWWWGGLLILLGNSGTAGADLFPALVRRFSTQAIWIVGALLTAALATAAMLLEFQLDLSLPYDQGLLAKLGLSLCLLALAGLNRFLLTPRLATDARTRNRMRAAIVGELLIFVGILATTAWLTTYQSPHDDAHGAALEAPVVDGPIAVYQPWAPAMVTSNGSGAGYMVIVNNQQADDHLVAAKSPWAEHVTLHRSITEDNLTRMRPVPGLRIPAGGRVRISPGAYHLMFTEVVERFVEGDVVPVTLIFERAGEVTFNLQVRPLGDTPTHGH